MNAIPSWLTILILSSALLIGCSGENEQGSEPPVPAPIPAAEQQSIEPTAAAALPSEEAAATPAEQLRQYVELPADYPADAPIYPGTKPNDVQQGEEGRVSVVFGSEDSPEQVRAYLHSFLSEQGWTISVEQSMDTGTILQAIKPDRLLSVLLSRYSVGEGKELTIIAVAVDK